MYGKNPNFNYLIINGLKILPLCCPRKSLDKVTLFSYVCGMFIKKITKTDQKSGNRYNYYRLCEGYRDTMNVVRHRTILNMGTLEGIENKQDRKMLAQAIENRLHGQYQFFNDSQNSHIQYYTEVFAKHIIDEQLMDIADDEKHTPQAQTGQNTDYQEIDLHSMEHPDTREIGPEWLCYQTLEKLELGDYLSQLGFTPEEVSQALMQIISRAVYPASERKTARWIRENSAVSGLCRIPVDKVNRHKLYRISSRLYEHKALLESYLSAKTTDLFGLEDKIVFFDLTNTYFEGRKTGSDMAQFGPSKENRSDAPLVALAAVINAEGFIKHSRIYRGNISDSHTLESTLTELAQGFDFSRGKPVVVMDAGILTQDNVGLLKKHGFDYIGVSRSRLKDYREVNPESDPVVVYDQKDQAIELKRVEKQDCDEEFLYVRSEGKAQKEASMNSHLSQRYEQGLENIRASLSKKGGIKKYAKVWERIGRLKERYPAANTHYQIEIIPDKNQDKAVDIKWEYNPRKPKSCEGVYFLRTSLQQEDEATLWRIYNTLTEVEATFRVLKTDLSLRPVFHKNDEHTKAHLFLGLLAYQVVATIRYQLKAKGIHDEWNEIVRRMSTQQQIYTTMKNRKNQTLHVRKCSRPKKTAREIYQALDLKMQPHRIKKSVVPP